MLGDNRENKNLVSNRNQILMAIAKLPGNGAKLINTFFSNKRVQLSYRA